MMFNITSLLLAHGEDLHQIRVLSGLLRQQRCLFGRLGDSFAHPHFGCARPRLLAATWPVQLSNRASARDDVLRVQHLLDHHG